MPRLLDLAQLNSSRWCGHADLHGITELCLATAAQQTVLGALWNFPGSGPPVWHRDGGDRLLVAVTAPTSYPDTVGFIHGQPQTHQGAAQAESPGPTLGETFVNRFGTLTLIDLCGRIVFIVIGKYIIHVYLMCVR